MPCWCLPAVFNFYSSNNESASFFVNNFHFSGGYSLSYSACIPNISTFQQDIGSQLTFAAVPRFAKLSDSVKCQDSSSAKGAENPKNFPWKVTMFGCLAGLTIEGINWAIDDMQRRWRCNV